MDPAKLVEYGVGIAVVVIVGSVVAGQLLGQPILLSYVETGSMEPILEPGDGFVAVPPGLTGDIEEGDVIVFDAKNLHDGGLVTHRVVDRTPRGFITKGDANPVTDQAGEEPPVRRSQVVAEAYQVGGRLVVIPNLGVAAILMGELLTGFQRRLATLLGTRGVLGTQGLAFILFGFGTAAYLLSEFGSRTSGRARTREVGRDAGGTDGRLIVAALTLLLVLFLTASMTVPAGTQEFGVVSSTTDAPGTGVIESGGTETLRYRVPSNGVLPVVVYLEPASEGIAVDPGELYVPGSQVRESIVELSAPSETGYYRRYLVEHRYLAVLPRGVIRTLYGVHPWLPIVAIDALLGLGFAGFGSGLLTVGRTRARSRDLPLSERLRRWLE
ncbi:MAG: signal peptidase I [Haloarculaceae archaeon]